MNAEESKGSHEERPLDLKARREEKGLSLRDIAEETRIHTAILETIENRNFTRLPEPVYTRAFIRAYTKALEINEEELLTPYSQYLDEVAATQQQVEAAGIRHTTRSKSKFAAAFIVLILALFIVFVVTDNREAPVPDAAPPAKDVMQAESQKTSPEPETAVPTTGAETNDSKITRDAPVEIKDESTLPSAPAQPDAETEEDTPSEPAAEKSLYRLDIEATELTWLQIIEDYNTPSEILMRPGDKITRQAAEKFILSIGNAGGVSVTFQGEPLGPLGEHGKVVRLNLPGDETNSRSDD